MSSAINHKRRSRRSHKDHLAAMRAMTPISRTRLHAYSNYSRGLLYHAAARIRAFRRAREAHHENNKTEG